MLFFYPLGPRKNRWLDFARWATPGSGVPWATNVEGLLFYPLGPRKNHGLDLRAYARQPARGVEVGGWRVEDWVRAEAEGVDVGRA